jgi:hypothetical protein
MKFIPINNISHIGDIIAIPFFSLLSYYLYNIEHKTTMEYVLFLFSLSGLLLDTIFSFYFLSNLNKNAY